MQIKRRTADLKPGDTVVFADLRDEVVSVKHIGGTTLRVDVIRLNYGRQPTFWFAGDESFQTVEVPDVEAQHIQNETRN